MKYKGKIASECNFIFFSTTNPNFLTEIIKDDINHKFLTKIHYYWTGLYFYYFLPFWIYLYLKLGYCELYCSNSIQSEIKEQRRKLWDYWSQLAKLFPRHQQIEWTSTQNSARNNKIDNEHFQDYIATHDRSMKALQNIYIG